LQTGTVVLTRLTLVASSGAAARSAWRWPYWLRWSLRVVT
jgi:hypothetical protein